MTTRLKLAEGLSLPLAAVTQKLAWLGVTGSGKTYGASKLAELFWAAGAQFVVLDPVGVWYGLRLEKNGKTPSEITIPIFGGLHGDVPLESTGGALLANLVVDKTLSAIIDVSQFESETDKARFARDFADRFFFRKKAAPSAVHLFLEECQEFVPQNPQKGEEHMLHAYIRMQKLGRNFGIGSSYISQRPQEVNKKALNMAQTLFVFRTTGTHERKAIESWIADKSLDQDIAGDLPKIATGDCHVWSPEFLKISDTVRILEKHTFNASATPEVGVTAKARELAPIDLDQVRAEMAATIEKAKAEDPRELRRQIAELKKQLSSSPATKDRGTTKTIEKPVLTETDRALLKKVGDRMEAMITAIAEHRHPLVARIVSSVSAMLTNFEADARDMTARDEKAFLQFLETKGFQKILGKLSAVGAAALPPERPVRAELRGGVLSTPRQAPTTSRPARLVSPAEGNGHYVPGRGGDGRMLAALAQFPDGVTDSKLAILSGMTKRGGAFRTYLSKLRVAGYVDGNRSRLRITSSGQAVAGDVEPLPTGDALLDYWRRELGESGARKIFDALIDAYPKALTKDQTAAASAMEVAGGAFRTYVSKLRVMGLIEGSGELRASEELF